MYRSGLKKRETVIEEKRKLGGTAINLKSIGGNFKFNSSGFSLAEL